MKNNIERRFSRQYFLQLCCALLFIPKGVVILTEPSHNIYFTTHPEEMQLLSGWMLIIIGTLTLLPTKILRIRIITPLLLLASSLLFMNSFSKFIHAGFVSEQLIEHVLQFFLPIYLFAVIRNSKNQDSKNWILGLKIAIALTFIGHGMFAIGVNYVPTNFIEMTMSSIPINQKEAYSFVYTIGVVDFVAAILLFVPVRILQNISFFYLITWGLLTAFARTYSVIGEVPNETLLLESIPNMLYRLIHGIVPAMLYYNTKRMKLKKWKSQSSASYLDREGMAV